MSLYWNHSPPSNRGKKVTDKSLITHLRFAFSETDSIVEQTFSVGREGAVALGAANFNFSILDFPNLMEERGFPEVAYFTFSMMGVFWGYSEVAFLRSKYIYLHIFTFPNHEGARGFSKVTFLASWF